MHRHTAGVVLFPSLAFVGAGATRRSHHSSAGPRMFPQPHPSLTYRATMRPTHVLAGHTDDVTSICAHAKLPGVAVTSSLDGTVRVWDLEEITCSRRLDMGTPVLSMTVHGRTAFLATQGAEASPWRALAMPCMSPVTGIACVGIIQLRLPLVAARVSPAASGRHNAGGSGEVACGRPPVRRDCPASQSAVFSAWPSRVCTLGRPQVPKAGRRCIAVQSHKRSWLGSCLWVVHHAHGAPSDTALQSWRTPHAPAVTPRWQRWTATRRCFTQRGRPAISGPSTATRGT